LESLARRLEEVERRLNKKQPSVIAATKDWRRVVGISEDNDFTRLVLTEIEAAHDAERKAALSKEAA
jgi:chromosome condensin MukBEF ATPase and DNA-binding subunit MukB